MEEILDQVQDDGRTQTDIPLSRTCATTTRRRASC